MTGFRGLALDACDVEALTRFWSDAANYEVEAADYPYWAVLASGESNLPRIIVIQVPELKSAKNRLHMEFDVSDLDVEAERLVELGAGIDARREFHGTRWIVMSDPEGNEFCLLEEASD